MSGAFLNCCCIPSESTFLMGLVKLKYFGFTPLEGETEIAEYDPPMTYEDFSAGGLWSHSMAVGYTFQTGTALSNRVRYLRYDYLVEQSTEYGGLRSDLTAGETHPKVPVDMYTESSNSDGLMQSTRRTEGVATVVVDVAASPEAGSGAARGNGSLTAYVTIFRRKLQITEDGYVFEVNGTFGDGTFEDNTFLYRETLILSNPYPIDQMLAYSRMLLALYDLDAETFNGVALGTDLTVSPYGANNFHWLCSGYDYTVDDTPGGTGVVLTPKTPTIYELNYLSWLPTNVLYTVVDTGLATEIPTTPDVYTYVPYKGIAMSVVAVEVDGGGNALAYGICSQVFYWRLAGVCLNTISVQPMAGSDFRKLVYTRNDGVGYYPANTDVLIEPGDHTIKIAYLDDEVVDMVAGGLNVPDDCSNDPP